MTVEGWFYRGRTFRQALGVRWAGFFDALDLAYSYEVGGLDSRLLWELRAQPAGQRGHSMRQTLRAMPRLGGWAGRAGSLRCAPAHKLRLPCPAGSSILSPVRSQHRSPRTWCFAPRSFRCPTEGSHR
jgi:hypothetical protein